MNEPMQGSRERDIPEKMSRLNNQLEILAKNIAELRERVKPIASPAPSVSASGTPSTPGLTPLGSQIMESTNRLVSLNDSLEEITHSIEV